MKPIKDKDLELLESVPSELAAVKIQMLKDLLRNTDYKAIKFAEGEITEEEFAPVREQRKAWRKEINEIESGIL